jgi:hypothetical protein
MLFLNAEPLKINSQEFVADLPAGLNQTGFKALS